MKRKRIGTHKRSLVLNADYTATGVMRWKRAVWLSVKHDDDPSEGVEVIDFYKDDFIQGPHGKKYPTPAVVRRAQYIRPKKRLPFNKKNVFLRDKLTCQYCGFVALPSMIKLLTYDHIIPRRIWKEKKYSGTPTHWTNIVTCCKECNMIKADRLPKEAGLKLNREPYEPSSFGFVLGVSPWQRIPAEWISWLPPLYREVLNL
jgi:5-methylcytosine-specific restriction endonuclease McrA